MSLQNLANIEVQVNPIEVNWDKDGITKLVDDIVEKYVDVVVQFSDIAPIKTEMAALNKVKDALASERKRITAEVGAPLDKFAKDVKALEAKITTVRASLDVQVKEFEKRERASRIAGVQFIIDNAINEAGIKNFQIEIIDRWLNKTVSTKKLTDEVKNIIDKEITVRKQAELIEQAKTERVQLVELCNAQNAEIHGFALSVSKFQHLFDINVSAANASAEIALAYAERKKALEAEKEAEEQRKKAEEHAKAKYALEHPVVDEVPSFMVDKPVSRPVPDMPVADVTMPVAEKQIDMPVADAEVRTEQIVSFTLNATCTAEAYEAFAYHLRVIENSCEKFELEKH